MQTISDLNNPDFFAQNKKVTFSDKLNLSSFVLLINPDDDTYSNTVKRNILQEEIEELIRAGLENLEVSWSSNENWLDFVNEIKINYPKLNLGSASIVNKQSIEDSIRIGLKFSMMKFWDKDLFNYAKEKGHLLVPGIKNLNDLREAINLNCKIIKIYPIKHKDDLIEIKNYKNIYFIAAGGLSISDINNCHSLGYKTIVIGKKGLKNHTFDPKIHDWLKKNTINNK